MRSASIARCSSGSARQGWRALVTAAAHPERVLGVISIASWAPYLTPPVKDRAYQDFEVERDSYEGWEKVNRHYWLRDWRGYAEFFFGELLSEPHSTKQFEDCVEWAMGIGPELMALADEAPVASESTEQTEALLRGVRCPVLAIHGVEDRCQPLDPRRADRRADRREPAAARRRRAPAAGARAGRRQPRDP